MMLVLGDKVIVVVWEMKMFAKLEAQEEMC